MTVQLVRLLDPARPQSFLDDPGPGKHLVAAIFTVRGVRGSIDDDAYNDAVLIGSNGKRYQWSFADLAGHHPASPTVCSGCSRGKRHRDGDRRAPQRGQGRQGPVDGQQRLRPGRHLAPQTAALTRHEASAILLP